MKATKIFPASLLLAFLVLTAAFQIVQNEPWKPEQLMPPSELAARISSPVAVKPLIISVGPAGLIKGSMEAGPAQEKENLDHLKKILSKESKDREIVIYCGCCPFKDCPNIRPAFSLLNEMKFTRHKLLNLPKNLKVDWIDHNYPMNDTK